VAATLVPIAVGVLLLAVVTALVAAKRSRKPRAPRSAEVPPGAAYDASSAKQIFVGLRD